jgi:hypothetical protein
MVNSGEALINVVMTNKRKMLTRLAQNGMWSSPRVILSRGADAAPPAKRRDLTHTATWTERGKPVVSPRDLSGHAGQQTARRAQGTAGTG